MLRHSWSVKFDSAVEWGLFFFPVVDFEIATHLMTVQRMFLIFTICTR
jgi:hypothetical protein